MEGNSNNEFVRISYSESTDRSDSESVQSTPEEERIRRLFFTCDTDGDGYITYDDIRQVCAQLDMDYCVEEIMQELGTDANGRISYSDFVKRRSELLDTKPSDTSEECESTVSESKEPLLEQSSQATSFEMSSVTDEQAFGSQANQLSLNRNDRGIWGQREVKTIDTESSGLMNTEGWLAFRRDDSWEFDSGLEVDTIPISLHKQIEASGVEVPDNINELLDLANRYYIESINSVKQEKSRIHHQLKTILEERQLLQKQILSLKEEKVSVIKELEIKKLKERKEYENKILELKSIIGELSQNLNYYDFLTIKEEEDESCEQEYEVLNKNSLDLNAIRNTNDSEDCNSECNLNTKIENISKCISKQIQSELVASEAEKVNKSGIDRIHSHDSHATALEIDRLECRISNLETQIDLSDLHLNQSKESAERLTVLLGKYDSNNSALQLALNYSDRALQVTEILVALLDTEIGLVLANCRAAGLGKNEELTDEEERAEVTRIYELSTRKRTEAEELALEYLQQNCPELEINAKNFCREHEIQLRSVVNKLKEEKAIVQNSITQLEPFGDHLEKECNLSVDSTPRDLTRNIENIVLMQDFIAVKETNANLRSQIHSLQRENSILAQQVMKRKSSDRKDSETNQRDWQQNKETNQKEKDRQSCDPMITDLKKVNEALNEELDKIKRKYSTKVKKLEQKIASMSQRNSAQVKILQNKISLLENDGSFKKSIETTL